MSCPSSSSPQRKPEGGIALLISIFVLLLVCVAGIAMVVASGTESALTGNYQSSTAVYYAAMAGLEEGRGRLAPQNPNFVNNTVPGFVSAGTMPIGRVLYIVNGGGVNPLDAGNPASFPDLEYDREFQPGALATANANGTVYSTPSVSAGAGLPGPVYKWVRINAITEQAINLDVDSNGVIDQATPLYYNGTSLVLAATGSQAFEVTALAAYPNGTQKILQYVAAAPLGALNLSLPAAVVLSGNAVQFSGPDYPSFVVNGADDPSTYNNATGGTCAAASPGVRSIGYTNSTDTSFSNITAPGTHVVKYAGNYEGMVGGTPATNPDVAYVGNILPSNLQTISGLNAFAQSVTRSADTVTSYPSGLTKLSDIAPAGMSASDPAIMVVNGDLDLTYDASVPRGYGLLLVTGTLTYDTKITWDGIILVIGKGVMIGQGWNPGQINGAVLLAKTVDDSGNPLSTLGPANFQFFNPGHTDPGDPATVASLGVRYSSCWINAVQMRTNYRILSFREINQ